MFIWDAAISVSWDKLILSTGQYISQAQLQAQANLCDITDEISQA